jgi:hypothetical protein
VRELERIVRNLEAEPSAAGLVKALQGERAPAGTLA